MKSDPKVAVVVVSHETKELLLECLASVFDSTGTDQIETVVVDNASSDGSYEAVCNAFRQVRAIRNEENRGFGAACNQAISSTVAPLVLLVNSDARLTPEGFTELLDCMQTNSRCGAAGCSVLNTDGEKSVNARNFLTAFNQVLEQAGVSARMNSRRLRRTHIPTYDENLLDCTVDWIDGACLMLRRSALDETGLFDERFFMYSEDEDLCFRLKHLGWSVCHSARGYVIHHGGASAARNKLEMFRHFYLSQMLFLLKHRGRASVIAFGAATRVVLLFKRFSAALRSNEQRRTELTERLTALRRAREDAKRLAQPNPPF
jgi:GT2 family glycosyltransferase